MAIDIVPSVESLASFFPLTNPIQNPKTCAKLLSVKDLHREEDLLRNPTSFRAWWTAISNTKEAINFAQKEDRPDVPPIVAALLGPLATPCARAGLQQMTYLYESALSNFPTSFKLWKAYLQMRSQYVLGKIIIRKRAGGKKRLPEMQDALEDEKNHHEQWEGGLDGVIGWQEWHSLAAAFERALMWIPNVCVSLEFLNF
jgi:pre-mRNA-splicing factor SYF1